MIKYLVDLKSVIVDLDDVWAHTHNQKRNETLLEHSNFVMDTFSSINAHNKILSRIEGLISDIVESVGFEDICSAKELLFTFFVNAIYLHDVGKISIGYQVGILDNPYFGDLFHKSMKTEHSPYSAIIYINEMVKHLEEFSKINTDEDTVCLLQLLIDFSSVVFKHHSSLDSKERYRVVLKEMIFDRSGVILGFGDMEHLCKYLPKRDRLGYLTVLLESNSDISNLVDNRLSKVSFEIFLLNKILFSSIVASDSIATNGYMNDSIAYEFKKINIESVMKAYRNTDIYKGIENHFKTGFFDKTINEVRCNIFEESTQNLLKNIDKNIFYLSAPTSSGKTNVATNLAFSIVERTNGGKKPINNIIYTAPFNSIITQTNSFFRKISDKKFPIEAVEVNSVTPIVCNENTEGELDYESSLLDYQLMNYPITLTSHVKLFNILFGTSRRDNTSLINLVNAVIIIDEVQAYRLGVWRNVIKMFDLYAKYMNIKFIIMSATLPKLDNLIDENDLKSTYADLINKGSKYYSNSYFKNRISLYDYSLLDKEFKCEKHTKLFKEEVFDCLYKKIEEIIKTDSSAKILVEFIKKRSCREFYDYIKRKSFKIPIREITGEDNKYFKEKIISEIEVFKSILVVATQVIECGVDIDMSYGFKDISYLDNEEQFIGRLNRSSKRQFAKVYFFDLDDADSIYSRREFSFKSEFSLRNKEFRRVLENKEYGSMFEKLLTSMKSQFDSKKIGISKDEFDKMISQLDYKGVDRSLMLIDDKKEVCLYFPFKIDIGERSIDGSDLWRTYMEMRKEKDYSKKNIILSQILCNMNYFIYKYNCNNVEFFEKSLLKSGFEVTKIDGIYYFDISKEEMSIFIDNDYKFCRDSFDKYRKIIR